MEVSIASNSDKKEINLWLTRRIGHTLHAEWFSDNICVAVKDNGRLLALIVLYFEAAGKIGQLGFILSNPENTPKQSFEAIRTGIKKALEIFTEKKVKFVMGYFAKNSMNSLLEECGFFTGDGKVLQKIKIIEGA